MKIRFLLISLLCAQTISAGAAGLVFTGEKDGNSELFRFDPKIMQIEQLSSASSNEMQAAISPDGVTVAFISDKSGAPSLYLAGINQLKSEWNNISTGMGAYANPAFSPDGSKIAVRYAPDPELPLTKTQLVIVDPMTKKQTVLLESSILFPGSDQEPVYVIDRPEWLDDQTLLFVIIEYADLETMRITSSSIKRVTLNDGKVIQVAGGESYFDEKGQGRGYKASMPKKNGGLISFVAIEGNVDRTPMSMTLEGKDKKVLPIQDPQFFGPVWNVGKEFWYGIQDDDGKPSIVIKSDGEKTRKTIPFAGPAFEPAFIP